MGSYKRAKNSPRFGGMGYSFSTGLSPASVDKSQGCWRGTKTVSSAIRAQDPSLRDYPPASELDGDRGGDRAHRHAGTRNERLQHVGRACQAPVPTGRRMLSALAEVHRLADAAQATVDRLA